LARPGTSVGFPSAMEGSVYSMDAGNAIKLEARRPTSSLAKHLHGKKMSKEYTDALEARVAEEGDADSILRAQHDLSERERPSPDRVATAMPVAQRALLIRWIMQAFEILNVDEQMVHVVALNIDRLWATSGEGALPPLPCLVLALACTEFKTDGYHRDREWKNVILQMGRGQIPLPQILKAEFQILSRLRYVVGIPTPLTFLRGLTQHLGDEAQRWTRLATFLLEMALLEPEVQYGCPHAFLAAGAFAASLRVLEAPKMHRQELLKDLEVWPIEDQDHEDLLWQCEEDVLQLWIRCRDQQVELEFYELYKVLEARCCLSCKVEARSLDPRSALAAVREEREPDHIKTTDWALWLKGGAPHFLAEEREFPWASTAGAVPAN